MRAALRASIVVAVIGSMTVWMPADARPPGFDPPASAARTCEGGDQVTLDGLSKLWPPNHKYADYSQVADGNTSGEMPTLQLVISNSDVVEGEELEGSGPPDDAAGGPDVNASSETAVDGADSDDDGATDGNVRIDYQLRAERSGKSREGRVYQIDFNATFDNESKLCTTFSDSDDQPEGEFETVVVVEPFLVCVPHDMRPSQRMGSCEAEGLPT